jgi:hypothetical protein
MSFRFWLSLDCPSEIVQLMDGLGGACLPQTSLVLNLRMASNARRRGRMGEKTNPF